MGSGSKTLSCRLTLGSALTSRGICRSTRCLKVRYRSFPETTKLASPRDAVEQSRRTSMGDVTRRPNYKTTASNANWLGEGEPECFLARVGCHSEALQDRASM